jgi:maleate isomerase
VAYVDGWRGRIGLITVVCGSSTEAEFNRYVPEGVAVLTTRIPLGKITPEAHLKMVGYVDEAASLLATAEVDVIVFADTAGSLMEGAGYDKKIIERLQDRTGVLVTTTATGVVEALNALNIRKICIATPYPDDVNLAEKAFLEGSGFEVARIKGLELLEPRLVPQVPPGKMYRLAKEVFSEDVEGLFISCTGLHVLGIIDMLEKDLGKPVITSNQVSLWSALKRLNVRDKIQGLGKLFTL